MSVSVYLFAVNLSEFSAACQSGQSEMLKRTMAYMASKSVDDIQRQETNEYIHEILQCKVDGPLSYLLNALYWLLEANCEKVEVVARPVKKLRRTIRTVIRDKMTSK